MDFSIFLRFRSSLCFNICGSRRFFFFSGSANDGADARNSSGPPDVDRLLAAARWPGRAATANAEDNNLNMADGDHRRTSRGRRFLGGGAGRSVPELCENAKRTAYRSTVRKRERSTDRQKRKSPSFERSLGVFFAGSGDQGRAHRLSHRRYFYGRRISDKRRTDCSPYQHDDVRCSDNVTLRRQVHEIRNAHHMHN